MRLSSLVEWGSRRAAPCSKRPSQLHCRKGSSISQVCLSTPGRGTSWHSISMGAAATHAAAKSQCKHDGCLGALKEDMQTALERHATGIGH